MLAEGRGRARCGEAFEGNAGPNEWTSPQHTTPATPPEPIGHGLPANFSWSAEKWLSPQAGPRFADGGTVRSAKRLSDTACPFFGKASTGETS